MSELIEIGAGVAALTDLVPLDGRISWVPPDRRGFEPHNKFVISNGEHVLLLDTGVAAHEQSLLKSLAPLVQDRKLTILVTRNELDCLGNLGALVDRYPDAQVISTNQLPVIGLVHLKKVARERIAVDRVRHGDALTRFGFPNLRIITPAIRVLGTGWVVDDLSRTLFPSDFFAADLLESGQEAVLRLQPEGFPTKDELKDVIKSKFDWIVRADRALVMARWQKVFSDLRLHGIAPSHGRITLGAPLVEKVIDAYGIAVEELLQSTGAAHQGHPKDAV
jgi:flavorubredoxin